LNRIHEEIDKTFDVFKNISNNAPKELVREYENKKGDKVSEVGPLVWLFNNNRISR